MLKKTKKKIEKLEALVTNQIVWLCSLHDTMIEQGKRLECLEKEHGVMFVDGKYISKKEDTKCEN